ncbi:MAG: N-acetylmuramoyl-L-alanine amidase [Lentisphaeria bacterium]|nr:N-acetylmuramoyl-L-alanine amidase [Lentisphaeria bacterium]
MSTSMPSRSCELALTLVPGYPVRFELHRTGETLSFDELVRRRPEGAVVLSAWSADPPPARVAEKLRAAGFRIMAAFGPGPKDDPWRRAEFGGENLEEEPERPAGYRKFLLPDTPEQRRKFPSPFRDGVGFVTIHNTAEPFSAYDERMRVADRRDARTSFHFAVDEREIVQLLPPDRHGWHAGDGEGDGNMRSIGVEICRSVFRGKNDWLYRRAEANAVLLAAELLRRFGLPLSALRMHRDWSGKYCPHRILAENSWAAFAARVAAKLAAPIEQAGG